MKQFDELSGNKVNGQKMFVCVSFLFFHCEAVPVTVHFCKKTHLKKKTHTHTLFWRAVYFIPRQYHENFNACQIN